MRNIIKSQLYKTLQFINVLSFLILYKTLQSINVLSFLIHTLIRIIKNNWRGDIVGHTRVTAIHNTRRAEVEGRAVSGPRVETARGVHPRFSREGRLVNNITEEGECYDLPLRPHLGY